ncbi:MAG: hypothetical protein ACM3TR_02155 [Caulobacteraceae bacterium]
MGQGSKGKERRKGIRIKGLKARKDAGFEGIRVKGKCVKNLIPKYGINGCDSLKNFF